MGDGAVVVGVDVGGTTTRAVAFDGDLHPTAWQQAATPGGAPAVAARVSELVLAVADGAPRALVAVGVPGRVDRRAGTVAGALNLGVADPAPIAGMIADAVGGPVHLENDVNAAALGAFAHFGLDTGASLAYVNIGTGIAAGFVLGGRLWRGSTGAAGEIGHIPMRPDGSRCRCGQWGCAEAIGSGRVGGADPARYGDVVAAAAWAVQVCVMTLDVDVVAVGGGINERPGFAGDLLSELAARESASPTLAAAGLAGRVRSTAASARLGSLGAVLAAREAS